MIKKVMSYKLWAIGCFFVLFFAYHLSLAIHNSCCAEPILSSELIENPQKYNGKEVVYEGEVIGQIMRRKLGAWVNINDGQNSLGIWAPLDAVEGIEYQGGYGVKGDIVQVKGIFYNACSDHGGDLDIHAISLRKIRSGWQQQNNIIPVKRKLVLILLVVLCVVLILRILIIR